MGVLPVMRFLDRYDLQEPITGGPIQVFVAQDITTGLRRLVHILECTEDSGALTANTVLQLLRRLAPAPPGEILEVGRYQKTSFVYLITAIPADPLSIRRWVESYETFSGLAHSSNTVISSREVSPPTPVVGSEQPTAALAISLSRPSEPSKQAAGTAEFTKLLEAAVPDQVEKGVPRPGRTEIWARRETGAFTKQFLEVLQDRPAAGVPVSSE